MELQQSCQAVKQQYESLIQEVRQSLVDCWKRRDSQLQVKAKAQSPVTSTLFHPEQTGFYPTSDNPSYVHPSIYKPPVKLDSPKFSGAEGEDPIHFIEL